MVVASTDLPPAGDVLVELARDSSTAMHQIEATIRRGITTLAGAR